MCAEIENTAALIDDMSDTYLTFTLNEQFYAIPINEVLQIVNMPPITEIPSAPVYLKGVTKVNDEITIAIDLKAAIGIANTSTEEERCMVVTYIKGSRIGFMVDMVSDVEYIEKSLVSEPPQISGEGEKNYLSGIANTEKGIVLIADIKNIMDEECLALCRDIDEKHKAKMAGENGDNTAEDNFENEKTKIAEKTAEDEK